MKIFSYVRLIVAVVLSVSRAAAATPVLTSVSTILPRQAQPIRPTGSGFGALAAYVGDSPFIEITDITGDWNAGVSNAALPNSVGLVITSWTDTHIAIAGFQGLYGQFGYVLNTGDQVQIQVWNAQTGAGPAVLKAKVASP